MGKEITQEMINEWKKAYGKIYKTVIADETVIWRKLKRKEYVEIMTEELEEDDNKLYNRQEKIAMAVIVWPENVDELIENNAGLATAITDEVIFRSGFAPIMTEEL